jgi:hypothetical protein
MGRDLRRAAALALVLAPLMALHLRFAPRHGPFGPDGSYYLQAARFVADENRLLTSVSLYGEALTPLPQPYRYAPLWPLLLGVLAKGIGLIAAANVLPQLLYLLDLVLVYLLANRMAAELGGAPRWHGLDVGHLAAVVAGLNFVFFTSMTEPYSEGLAFACGLASFLALDRQKPALAGALAGLSCLARYQMVAIPIATLLVLLLAQRVGAAGRYAALTVVVVTPWMLYLHAVPVRRVPVAVWQEWIHPPAIAGQLGQIVRGLLAAFDPRSPASFFNSFGALVLLVPLALFAARRIPPRTASVALSGLLCAPMLALYESTRFHHWLFGERHALLFGLAVIAALVVCVARGGRVVRVAAILLAGVAPAQGLRTIVTTIPPAGEGVSSVNRQLIAWLDAHARGDAVLTTNAQVLSVYSRNPMYWTDCDVGAETTRPLLQRLPIAHVVVYDREKSCAFARGLHDVLVPEAVFSDGWQRVYLFGVTRKMASSGTPSRCHTATGWNERTLSNTTSFAQSWRKTNITYAGRVRLAS